MAIDIAIIDYVKIDTKNSLIMLDISFGEVWISWGKLFHSPALQRKEKCATKGSLRRSGRT
jgi:hypothetical protein